MNTIYFTDHQSILKLYDETTVLNINFKSLHSVRSKIIYSKSSHRRRSVEKVFLEISQNSQENTCVTVSSLAPATLLKRDSGTGVFL